MCALNEKDVSNCLSEYLQGCGLHPLGKKSPFTHDDDVLERSFEIDLAIGPIGTFGNRTPEQASEDRRTFDNAAEAIDPIVDDLLS